MISSLRQLLDRDYVMNSCLFITSISCLTDCQESLVYISPRGMSFFNAEDWEAAVEYSSKYWQGAWEHNVGLDQREVTPIHYLQDWHVSSHRIFMSLRTGM